MNSVANMYGIPEEHRTCDFCKLIASKNLCIDACTRNEEGKYAMYEPAEYYLKAVVGCKACAYYSGGKHSYVCNECKRHYEDLWEEEDER